MSADRRSTSNQRSTSNRRNTSNRRDPAKRRGTSKRRNLIISLLGIAVAGGLAFEATNVFGGKDTPKSSSDAAAVSTPTGPSTATADPQTPTPAQSTDVANPSTPSTPFKLLGTEPGAFAADGVTPLSDYPSLVRIGTTLNGTTHVTTTIDPKYQAAAATALTPYDNAAMAVVQPSTGHILALAFKGQVDPLMAEMAPGSTFKVVTTEDLLRNGATVNTSAPCREVDPKYGFHNDEASLTKLDATLGWAFVNSCNTSFVGLMSQATSLNQESTKYFGLNQPWDLGLGKATYGAAGTTNVPTAVDGDFGQEMFGQGRITVSPLDMASVAATVAAGRFHQPVLLAGQKPIAGATPLDPGIDRSLQQLMHQTVTQGTASSLRGITPAVGAKTGTADPGGGRPMDSWMIAYQGDVAVACVVQGGGHGNDAAGPAIATLLKTAR